MNFKDLGRFVYFPLRNRALFKPIFRDVFGVSSKIQTNEFHLKLAADWLKSSQEANQDGGSASHFDVDGWLASFPETTGYIVPTLLEYSKRYKDDEMRKAADKMGEFLLNVQLDNGAFQGGSVAAKEKVPTVFNTGQILFGLVDLYKATNDQKYLNAAEKAGDWLCDIQDENGSWTMGLSPNADNVPHAYNVRAAWALLELNTILNKEKYVLTNEKNVIWTLKQKNAQHWFANNSFFEGKPPYTHNIGYVLRGVLESGIATNNEGWILEVKKSVDELSKHFQPEGFFYSQLDDNWRKVDNSTCLTGNLQLGIIYAKLYLIYKEDTYLNKMTQINSFHKKIQIQNGSKGIKGAIPGSRPFWGKYCPYSYPNWATKFFMDALLIEQSILDSHGN